jgi:hypothetical protein
MCNFRGSGHKIPTSRMDATRLDASVYRFIFPFWWLFQHASRDSRSLRKSVYHPIELAPQQLATSPLQLAILDIAQATHHPPLSLRTSRIYQPLHHVIAVAQSTMCPKAVSSRRASTPVDSGSCFSCTRLNLTTFQILEDDKYFELPIIYAKITESAIVLLDTGCGGAARDPNCSLRSLRLFLETYPVVDNENRPLNEGGKLDYVVICSHCHFDHIGSIHSHPALLQLL